MSAAIAAAVSLTSGVGTLPVSVATERRVSTMTSEAGTRFESASAAFTFIVVAVSVEVSLTASVACLIVSTRLLTCPLLVVDV